MAVADDLDDLAALWVRPLDLYECHTDSVRVLAHAVKGRPMTRTGADISHHQLAWDAAAYKAAGEDFIILKATEGGSYTDPTFTNRWRAAGAIDLARGAYAFARPGGASVDAQADHFLATVRAAGFEAGDAWALDLEDAGGLGPASLLAWADRWCTRVRTALGGRGLFYSGVAFILQALGDPGRIPGGCLGWIARYRSDSPWASPWRRPGGWPEVPDVWQCTNGAEGCVHDVAGVGRCDWNKATDAAYAALFGREETDMPLTPDDLKAVRGVVREELSGFYDTLVDGDATHPVTLRAILKAAGVTVTDAQAELIGGRILAALQVGRLTGTVAVELGPE